MQKLCVQCTCFMCTVSALLLTTTDVCMFDSVQALHSLFQRLHGQQPVEVVLPPVDVCLMQVYFKVSVYCIFLLSQNLEPILKLHVSCNHLNNLEVEI